MAIAAAVVAIGGVGIAIYGLTTKVPLAGATYTPATVGTTVPQAHADPQATPLSRSAPVKIQIPAILVSAPVMEVGQNSDGSVQVPPLGIHNLTGWYNKGPTPGQMGASVILGHVDSNRGISVFYYLKDLIHGDQIRVTLADGSVANFVVDGLEKVTKTTFPTSNVYGTVPYPGLRLVTCGGPFDGTSGHYLDNIIVYAHLVHAISGLRIARCWRY
jgi:sortase (surface protein transpeptidase)